MSHTLSIALTTLLCAATCNAGETICLVTEYILECDPTKLPPSDSTAAPKPEGEQIAKNLHLTFYGDTRLRYEDDFDSHTTAGLMRLDRLRGRARIRGGFDFRIGERWSAGFRLRTGSVNSQQSPHLTFASNDGVRDPVSVVADRYFVQFRQGGASMWAGRNTTPFWQQNELFWDEDVTPAGMAVSYETRRGQRKFTATAGAFYVPDGGLRLNGQMFAGQIRHNLGWKKSQFTFAAGLHYLRGRQGAPNLLNRNGQRNYLIGVNSVQWSIPMKSLPLTFGADLFQNFLNYSAADVAPFPAKNRDQTRGYAISAQLGQLKKRQDWLFGGYYAYIERFSVNASYAQDDWIRFGNGVQTEASDFKGVEIRSGYAVSRNINLLARLYLVHAITTPQDGKRFRLDLNWKL